jgi:hypothetical protein
LAGNPNGRVRNLMLPDSEHLTAEFKPALLKGVTVVKSKAVALAFDAQGEVTKTEQEFTAIPYYAWPLLRFVGTLKKGPRSPICLIPSRHSPSSA